MQRYQFSFTWSEFASSFEYLCECMGKQVQSMEIMNLDDWFEMLSIAGHLKGKVIEKLNISADVLWDKDVYVSENE